MFYAFSLKYVVPMLHTYHIPLYSLGSNGQRPGAIINMEVQEEEKATEEEVDGVRVVTIKVFQPQNWDVGESRDWFMW